MKDIPVTRQAKPRRRGSYGIDAPLAFGALAVLTVACVVMNTMAVLKTGRLVPLVPILLMLTVAVFVLHTTLRGKFVIWAELLDTLDLRGDEHVLDLGCGRGAVLLMVAQRLTTGRAVGVDLWQSVDQSGNSAEATRRNAVAEGVADQVELHTGDMTELPFEDNSFDLVVSSLAIHNISGKAGREQAISEAARVLRPGGRLMIADIRATRQYRAKLAASGMNEVACRRLGWQFWWGGPWAPTRLVTATKPARLMAAVAELGSQPHTNVADKRDP
jgi:ubiquinone/menaquinone biosynthesis C-methylase UbiE